MKAIGIDLGTVNSVVSYYDKGEVKILNIDGQKTVPSVVFFDKNGSVLVGNKAKSRIFIAPERVLSSTKTKMGTDWTKTIDGKTYTPVDAAAFILSHLKKETEKLLNEPVEEVVITVPAYFEPKQKEDTKKAAEKAGLKVKRLLPEPTSAAINYGIEKENINQIIVVIDLGGGTFDVSILEVRGKEFNVKSLGGDTQLGGDNFDMAIVEYILDYINNTQGVDLSGNNIVIQKLKEEAEKIKIELSTAENANIYIPKLTENIDVDIENFTRKTFKSLIDKYLIKIKDIINDTITSAGLTIDDINRFVLVGGSCKHPVIQELIKENFREPYVSSDVDTAVSSGAAIVSFSLLAPSMQKREGGFEKPLLNPESIKEAFPQSIGVNIFKLKSDITQETKDNNFFQKFVNKLKLQKDYALVIHHVIEKNTTYPCKKAMLFFTNSVWQEDIETSVYLGESIIPDENKYLGKLNMKVPNQNIGKGITPLACLFSVDKNGILSFSMMGLPIGKEKEIEDLIEHAENHNNEITIESIDNVARKFRLSEETISINLK